MSGLKILYGGLKSYVSPFSYSMASSSVDTTYGYALWLRHLVTLARHGIRGPFNTVVELGPGNSIATGIAALLCGAQRYIGLDVLAHMDSTSHARVLEEMLQLFHQGSAIPDAAAYPALYPMLEDYRFPEELLSGGAYGGADELRTNAVLRAVLQLRSKPDGREALRYIVPWRADSVAPESVDLVFSQAVLQEIPHDSSDALRQCFTAMAGWLRPGGIMSHQVDFGMYGLEPWNTHWTWSDLKWRLVRGRRGNYVNREPLSTYEGLLQECNLSIVAIEAVEGSGAEQAELAPRYAALSERDRRTRTATIIARKIA